MLQAEGALAPSTPLSNEMVDALQQLRERQIQHPLWSHRLLAACKDGLLSVDDYRYFFCQYHD